MIITPDFGNRGPDAVILPFGIGGDVLPMSMVDSNPGPEAQPPTPFRLAPVGLSAGEIAMNYIGIDPTTPGNKTYFEVHNQLTPVIEQPGKHKADYTGE